MLIRKLCSFKPWPGIWRLFLSPLKLRCQRKPSMLMLNWSVFMKIFCSHKFLFFLLQLATLYCIRCHQTWYSRFWHANHQWCSEQFHRCQVLLWLCWLHEPLWLQLWPWWKMDFEMNQQLWTQTCFLCTRMDWFCFYLCFPGTSRK